MIITMIITMIIYYCVHLFSSLVWASIIYDCQTWPVMYKHVGVSVAGDFLTV